MTTDRIVRITDPAKSLERIYARLYEAEQFRAEHEAAGRTAMVGVYNRRIRSLRSAATRIGRMACEAQLRQDLFAEGKDSAWYKQWS